MNETPGLWVRWYRGRPPPLVALHGFTQTGGMFAELAEILGAEVLAPDLPGHGRSAEYPATFQAATEAVAEILEGLDPPTPLIGYSQGGRVALAVALERPELVSRIVLASASPGIEDDSERAERRRLDESRAALLHSKGLTAFVGRWLSNPMFDGLDRRGADWQAADRASRLENTADGLAAALIGMGQGAQPYLGDRLSELAKPVLVIAGEKDPKFLALAKNMCQLLPNAVLQHVPESGHAVIGEQPRAVGELVAAFLVGPEQ